jgi:hypothetical protein
VTVPYRHVVLFRLHDDVDETTVAEVRRTLERLGDVADALRWSVALSDDTRKGRILVEDTLFASREAFETFRAHPAHAAAGARLREVADWWVADYADPSGT